MAMEDILAGVLWPLLAAALALAAGLLLRRKRWAEAASGALAIALALIAGDVAVRGFVLNPSDATRWLPHIAAILGAVGITRSIAGSRNWMLMLTGLAIGGGVALLLQSGASREAPWLGRIATLIGYAIIVVVAHLLGRLGSIARPMWMPPLLLAAACPGIAITLGQSYIGLFGQLAGAVATGLGLVALLAMVRPKSGDGGSAAGGAMPVATALLALLILAGAVHGPDVHAGSAALLLAMLPIATLAALPLGPKRTWIRLAVGFALTILLSALAVWLSPEGFNFTVDEYGY